jgi:hypothetical protein
MLAIMTNGKLLPLIILKRITTVMYKKIAAEITERAQKGGGCETNSILTLSSI